MQLHVGSCAAYGAAAACATRCCRHAVRAYSGLGVDMWLLKLRAPLAGIAAQPGTYASGRVSGAQLCAAAARAAQLACSAAVARR